METDIRQVRAIDTHSHLGPSHGTFRLEPIENGTTEYLLRTMQNANIDVSVNTSQFAIIPAGNGFAAEGNRQLLSETEKHDSLYMWVTVDPSEPDTFPQARELLCHPKVLGIKIHPSQHGYELKEHGDAIFSFASECGAPVLGHSGERCCMPEQYGFFADRFPDIPIIAAHLGCGYDGDFTHQIRAIEENRAGNLYTDTSSMMSLMANLLEYAVERIGSERILFGTDSRGYFSPCQRVRVDFADIAREHKLRILRENALRLFPMLKAKA